MKQQKLHNKSHDPRLEKHLEDLLSHLYFFHKKEIDLSLKRVERFLEQLGNPHLKLPPVIHVAGTNGKGSTLATLRSLLEASGKSVHMMTSPHLVHPTERIRLGGVPITTQAMIDVIQECLDINHDEPITFFEMFTAAGFLAMSRQPADYVLLETGMGGRLDATNVIPKPACTIITTISKDHEAFLGSDLKMIASEKAGIMKAGVPCVIGYQTNEAIDTGILDVFHKISQSLSPEAPLFQHGSEWSVEAVHDSLIYEFQGEKIKTDLPNLAGKHQIYNVGAALTAHRIIMDQAYDAKILSPASPVTPHVNPLKNIFWPGRLQQLENHPLNHLVSDDTEIWIDGGHNDSAGYFLAQQAKLWQEEDSKPLDIVLAMVDRKKPEDFIGPLIPYAHSITVTEIKGEDSSYKSQDLYDVLKQLNIENLSMADTVEQACRDLSQKSSHRILITGSLYLLGTILS